MDNFIAEIRLFAGTFAPDGWLFCDGSLQPIGNYEELYTLIGTTYGGDGVSTFQLPDLRARIPVHQDGNTYTPGVMGGLETVALQPVNLPPHSHSFAASTTPQSTSTPTTAILATPASNVFVYRETTGTVALNASTVSVAGSSLPHENRQPYQALNYIIATAGIFPSQG
jgi:microcystin-dependent protein